MDAQVHEMKVFATKQGWNIVDTYLMPETRSSDLDRAPEYQRMLEDARAKKWDVLLCHKLDRLGRDRDMVVMFKAKLRRQGLEIRSVVENLTDSIEHRMLEQIYEVFSDFYARNLGNETRKGHRQLTRQGYWKGGAPAWGLQTVEVEVGAKTPRKRLAPCPVRGPLMVQVFSRVAAGEAPEQVRRWVASQTSEPEWKPQAFYARIHNPIYYGRLEYGRTTVPPGRRRKKGEPEELTVGEWEGLITKELWEAANDVIASNKRKYTRQTNASETSYLLTGLVKCQECGGPVVGSRANGHRKYRCNDRKCTNSSVRADVLEEEVLRGLAEAMEAWDEAKVVEAVRVHFEPLRQGSREREAELRSQLTEISLRKRRIIDAIEQGGDPATFNHRLRELAEEESKLAQEIALCQHQGDARASINLAEFCNLWLQLKSELAKSELRPGDREDLQLLMRHLIEAIISIPKKEGQLFIKLALDGAEAHGLVYGRSAPTRGNPCAQLRISASRLRFPFRHPFQRAGGIKEIRGDSPIPVLQKKIKYSTCEKLI